MNRDYLNPKLSATERTEILLSQMTIEEKVGQLMQISVATTVEVKDGNETYFEYGVRSDDEIKEWVQGKFVGSLLHCIGDQVSKIQEMALSTRLGIPILFGIDAIHGHGLHNGATIFPTQLGASCSWNKKLVEQMGRVTAKEVVADGLHWTFSPVLCIGRDLRWGRINETFGEDPFLIGELGAAIIKGYQGRDLSDSDSILACAKHYIAYGESIGGRDAYESPVSIRRIKDIFLKPFKRAVDAGCATFMTSYQSIDGVPATVNKTVLKDLLRDELGFKGFLVTDWDNVDALIKNQSVAHDIDEASRLALEAGNDMIMNSPAFYDACIKLVKSGLIDEEIIDNAVRNVLNIKFSMGLFEKARQYKPNTSVFSCDEHLKTNLELTRESIVLLENKNDILPLSNKINKIAVIGPNADDIYAQYGDWTYFSHPTPKKHVIPKRPYYTMLEGIKEVAKAHKVDVSYHYGCDVMDPQKEAISEALDCAQDADVIVAVVGDCVAQNGEFKDRANLSLSGAQQRLLEELKSLNKPLIVVLVNGKPLAIPWIKENADAVLETFNSGMMGGKVVGEILFGETNPSGKLSISFPYDSCQLPVYYNNYLGWHGKKYIDMPSESLYHFGYGLSYTTFKYECFSLSHAVCNADDTITAYVDVTNIGMMDGSEIVQLYVRDLVSSVMTPVKQLKGFEKVELKVGETKTVAIDVPIKELAIVNPQGEYVVEPGTFEIMIGPDSRDEVLLKAKFKVV